MAPPHFLVWLLFSTLVAVENTKVGCCERYHFKGTFSKVGLFRTVFNKLNPGGPLFSELLSVVILKSHLPLIDLYVFIFRLLILKFRTAKKPVGIESVKATWYISSVQVSGNGLI